MAMLQSSKFSIVTRFPLLGFGVFSDFLGGFFLGSGRLFRRPLRPRVERRLRVPRGGVLLFSEFPEGGPPPFFWLTAVGIFPLCGAFF